MADMNVFAFDSQAVRVVMESGEPWFVGKDVAVVLGYADTVNALKQHCKGVVKRHPLQTAGGMQDVRIISEPDMLRLIVGSKLPAAERFERWVFEEVLPSIRKTGSYVDPQASGALGACMQPLPYLSHVADFHVAADRVFRAVLRSARSAGLPLPQALRRANTVAQAQTGMDVLAMLNADDHLRALEAHTSVAPARQHASAARFWQEWMAGGIDGLPYQTCLAAQAYQAYAHWCSLSREPETARREVFTASVIAAATQVGQRLRVKVMRIGDGPQARADRVLLVSEPPHEGQGAWATALVQSFDERLRAYLAQRRQGVRPI